MLRCCPLPSLKSEWGYTLPSVTFDAFVKLIQEQMKQLDTRDTRDPGELGSKLLSRPKHIPIEKMADLLDKEYLNRRQGE